MTDLFEMRAIASGRVQGVGFRATVHRLANQLELKGYVQNLPDGTVEIVAQGAKSTLDHLLHEIEKVFGHGFVAHFETEYSFPQQPLTSFVIKK